MATFPLRRIILNLKPVQCITLQPRQLISTTLQRNYANTVKATKKPEEEIDLEKILEQNLFKGRKLQKEAHEKSHFGLEQHTPQDSLTKSTREKDTKQSVEDKAFEGSVDETIHEEEDEVDPIAKQIQAFQEDEDIQLLTNCIMKDGKKAQAQRLVGEILMKLRNHTEENSRTLLKKALDQISPYFTTTTRKRATKVYIIPRPLNHRQSKRKAIGWLIKYSQKRTDRVFAVRFVKEILEILEGKSEILKLKQQLHQSVLANRTNLQMNNSKRRSLRI